MIYFIQDSSTHEIKIGYTGRSATDRVASLQVGNPSGLFLLACHPGGEDEEAELHDRFGRWRVRGEWFEPASEIIVHICAITGIRGRDSGKHEVIGELLDHSDEWPEWLRELADRKTPPEEDCAIRYMQRE